MSPARATLLALLTAAVAFLLAVRVMDMSVAWAALVCLPPAAAVLVAALFVGGFDQDWTPEPDQPTTTAFLHASQLTDRLAQAADDHYRFTSRVQPRLRRLALSSLRRRPDTADIADLHDPRAREVLGDDLHALLTGSGARLPKPDVFADMIRRLEEL
jgi:hypothetical protein